jgi:transposase-like protein
MTKKELDFDEVISYFEKLPFNKFREVVEHYSTYTKTNFESELEDMVTLNLQQRLQKLNINTSCPKCNSNNIIKYGKKKRTQRYRCNDCNILFTIFTGTILEKTKWHWDIWIAVLNMVVNSFSLKQMENVLEKEYGFMVVRG